MIDFGGMGSLGRAAFFLGILGAVVAVVGGVMWSSASGRLDDQGWYFYRHRDPMVPYMFQAAYKTLDGAQRVVYLGGALSLLALVLGLLNLNQQNRPRSTGLPILSAAVALAVAVSMFAVCTPPAR